MHEIFGLLLLAAAIVAAVKNPYRRSDVADRLERREATVRMKARLGMPLDWDDAATVFAQQMR